jgi:hypothetical protein
MRITDVTCEPGRTRLKVVPPRQPHGHSISKSSSCHPPACGRPSAFDHEVGVFWHVATMGALWREIVADQYQRLGASGLIGAASEVGTM